MSCAIGICAALERARWGPWEDEATILPRSYSAAVQRAGALALLLPPDESAAATPDLLLDRVDGLMLAGGADVDPSCYGARPHPELGPTWRERDEFEISLASRALERGMPVLGVCRGMQVINVARGGTLIQHLPDVVGHDEHRHTPGSFGDHEVRLEPGSVAARAAGGERVLVKSHHHQGIGELGRGLAASGWSGDGELIEALEAPEQPFALGVLWHPEEDRRSRVIESLVEAVLAGVCAR